MSACPGGEPLGRPQRVPLLHAVLCAPPPRLRPHPSALVCGQGPCLFYAAIVSKGTHCSGYWQLAAYTHTPISQTGGEVKFKNGLTSGQFLKERLDEIMKYQK